MNLCIITSDPIQGRVLTGVAERAGWGVERAASLRDVAGLRYEADAIILDVEYVDAALRMELRGLAATVGRERVFLLVERATDVLPTPQELGVQLVEFTPVNPADFLRRIQASTAGVSPSLLQMPRSMGEVRRAPRTDHDLDGISAAA